MLLQTISGLLLITARGCPPRAVFPPQSVPMQTQTQNLLQPSVRSQTESRPGFTPLSRLHFTPSTPFLLRIHSIFYPPGSGPGSPPTPPNPHSLPIPFPQESTPGFFPAPPGRVLLSVQSQLRSRPGFTPLGNVVSAVPSQRGSRPGFAPFPPPEDSVSLPVHSCCGSIPHFPA